MSQKCFISGKSVVSAPLVGDNEPDPFYDLSSELFRQLGNDAPGLKFKLLGIDASAALDCQQRALQ
jgi:hypothetical protein